MKKRILVLGAAGMAGHMIHRYLISLDKYEVEGTTRTPTLATYALDIETRLSALPEILKLAKPDVIINCIGLLVKPCQDNPAKAAYINSFFPHFLEHLTEDTTTKVIHLSTDCVFDGHSGPYKEIDLHTETNFYGKSKSLGELNNDKDLTLRTSITGPELKDGTGLFHWFSKQRGEVNGYSNNYWNGITTLEMAKQIDKILDRKNNLSGIYHCSPRLPITKGDLLQLIKDIWERTDVDVTPVPAEEPHNKALINSRKKEYHPHIPSYPDQLKELKKFLVAV